MIFHLDEATTDDVEGGTDSEITPAGEVESPQLLELFRPMKFPCKDCKGGSMSAEENNGQTRHTCVEADLELVIEQLKKLPGLGSTNPILDILPAALEQESPISGDLPGLERAIRMRRSMLSLYPTSHGARKFLLEHLAVALRSRFHMQGGVADVADIDEAIANYREILALVTSDDPYLPQLLESLAGSLKNRFGRLQDPSDLDEAIECYQRVLLARPDEGDVNRTFLLYHVASALKLRFERSGDLDDLNLMINYHQQGIPLLPSSKFASINHHMGLAYALLTRYQSSNNDEDMERAIALQKGALAALPQGHMSRQSLLLDIGTNLLRCVKLQKNSPHLNEGIRILEEALKSAGEEHDMRVPLLISLATANYIRFNKSRRLEDIDKSLMHCREALNLPSSKNSDYRSVLNVTAASLLSRYRVSADPKDLEESISYNQRLLDLLEHDSPAREQLDALTHLAKALRARFASSGNMSDINLAIVYLKKAAQVAHAFLPGQWTGALNELATSLQERYEHTGDLADSDNAVTLCRQVIGLLPPGHPNHSASVKTLADVLCTRGTRIRHGDDLDEAVRYLYALVSTTEPTDSEYPDALMDLAHALYLRSKIGGEGSNDITIAENLLRKALDMCPESHPSRSKGLSELAHVLHAHSKLLDGPNTPNSLNDLVAISRADILAQNPEHLLYSENQFSLASALDARYKDSKEIGDLEEAIAAYLKAEAGLPEDHPLQGLIGVGLASSYLERSRLQESKDDYNEAFSRYEKASNKAGSGSIFRFFIARTWAFAARLSSHHSALKAFTACLSLLDRHVMVSHTVESKQQDLAKIHPTLVPNAASCAINEGQLESAVELLEQGRAILWSQVGRYRMPLDQLSIVDPDLAKEFHRLSVLLDKDVVGVNASPDREAARYRLLSSQWDTVVERIRKIDGLSDFLKTTPFTTLQQAAASGPVIIINIDGFRSDAMIIRSSSPPVLVQLAHACDLIPLLSADLKAALQLNADDSKLKNTIVIGILRQLWEFIISPIVDELRGNCAIPLGARVWWCPTASLWSLPLHAAGPYKKGERNLPDIFTSSYTPTLSALLRSLNRQVSPPHVPRTTLLVGQTQTPGQAPLPSVAEEIRQVQELAPSVTLLDGERATRAAIISDLGQSAWVHFACHGHQDLLQPFNSHFSVYDGPLTLLDIIQNGLPNAELAFLSACHSAAGDQKTPNEAIHLAAGLQFSGFAGVVGTLWAMADVDGPVVAREFYKYMMRKPGGESDYRDGAVALNRATKELRKMNVPVERWINFIHIGA